MGGERGEAGASRRGADLSVEEARRLALAAQGFDRPRPKRPDVRHLREVIRRLGLLQIDYVNVLVPAHYQVPFSRLGAYDRAALDDLVYRRREFVEQWAHEASIVPVERWSSVRHLADGTDRRVRALERYATRSAGYVDLVRHQVRARGALAAGELHGPDDAGERDSWGWTEAKVALELLFVRGELAIAERRSDMARVFDLAERVIPATHRDRAVGREEAQRELLHSAGRAHGVGTAADLADYYRMPARVVRPRLMELVESGTLREVRVEGWRDPAYLDPAATMPRRIGAATLLSPFDPLIWFRPRVARLFAFDYRFEIFFPRAKRKWGYYVLPFLLGERLVARVDLKAERTKRKLLVQAAYIEPHADPRVVAAALVDELSTLAGWLELDSVAVARRGDFARTLKAEVSSRG